MDEKQHTSSSPHLVYLDSDLLIFNKPAGLLSVPDGYDPNLPHLRSVLEPIYGRLWIVHRLDRGTSGLIILAKNEASHRKLNALFRRNEIFKIYHGLVTPSPDFNTKNIRLPLKTNADREHRTRVNLKDGKPAQSTFRVVKRFDLGALIEITILTGITHQIRAHFRVEDLALFGDTLYTAGLPPQPLPAPRVMLHARELGFRHPANGKPLRFSANYPEDFRNLYTQLRFTKALDEGI
jgi:tRNA pseudouridine32 synthase / 23S rRNA pseudouridine746 synthase